MNSRTFVKQFLPPLLLDMYRSVTRRAYIWDGVYPSFRDVPAAGPGFNGDDLANPSIAETKAAILIAKESKAAASEVINEYAMLALLASGARRQNEKLTVLDFGGGVGLNYVHLLRALGENSTLDYHIDELDWACDAGPLLFPKDDRIHFHRTLPETLPDLNILCMSGVLPYIED